MQYNKGLAFTEAERDRLYLRGLLPPAVLSQEVQADRVMQMIRSKSNDLDKHTYLLSLQVRTLLASGSFIQAGFHTRWGAQAMPLATAL